jgi:hypothetical protein
MVQIGDAARVEFVEATHLRLIEDAIFFSERSFEFADDATANRFARTAVLYSCLYLESLSNLVLEKLQEPQTTLVSRLAKGEPTTARLDAIFAPSHPRNTYGHPKKLAAIAAVLADEVPSHINAIHDLFEIRNQVIAHPAPFSSEIISGEPRRRVDKEVRYLTGHGLPFTLSQIRPEHAQELLLDVSDLLNHIGNAVTGGPYDALASELKPAVFMAWSHRVRSHRHWIDRRCPLWDDWQDWFAL